MSSKRRTEPADQAQPAASSELSSQSTHFDPPLVGRRGPRPSDRVVCLIEPAGDILLGCSAAKASKALLQDDLAAFADIRGQFAICEVVDDVVRMARTIGRPMRYFLANRVGKPILFIAERIDQISDAVKKAGLEDQFRPEQTRMVPAHYRVEIPLEEGEIGFPKLDRYFTPNRLPLPADVQSIGREYIGRLAEVIDAYLETIADDQPLGVMFSGGIDSGSIMVLVDHLAAQRGWSPTRIKAFTLSVIDPENPTMQSRDVQQARDFLAAMNRQSYLEVLEVPIESVQWRQAVDAIEDYKPLDVQSATMGLAMLRELRRRYPDWIHLIDGDGGDENLRDYPIEHNPRLTIGNVIDTPLLYQEGWGIDSQRHSQTYSGGQSRGHSRTSAPGAKLGFKGFSAYALPCLIEITESIPLAELVQRDPKKLYSLKGQIVAAGIEAVTGFRMPVFPKQRFQHGAASRECFGKIFPANDNEYRSYFESKWSSKA